MGQTQIDPKLIAEELILSLGSDNNINVKRHRLETDANVSFWGSTKTQVFTYEILIKNNKSQSIEMDVLDQIPLSDSEEIEIELVKSDKAEYTADFGKLLWNVELKPNEIKKIRFSYSVKHPSEKDLTGL